MKLKSAIRAAAKTAPATAIDALDAIKDQVEAQGALDNERRAAHLIGQCAHESGSFTRTVESLFYTTPDRLLAVFPRHFKDLAEARGFTRNSEKVANRVYADRMGNGSSRSGDGFRFRGRGYLQLTGRDNYRVFGRRIGVDLENNPDLAAEPETAWLIAADYLANRKRKGKTAFEWADENNVEAVTRIVNGGIHGLEDRRRRTGRALSVLEGGTLRPLLKSGDEGHFVEILQHALAAKGFSPGAIDGDFGTKTRNAVKAFQASVGLKADGKVGEGTWKKLEPLPA